MARKQTVKLSFVQRMTIWNWLSEHAEGINDGKIHRDDAQAELIKLTGLPLTIAHITSVAATIDGITWVRKNKSKQLAEVDRMTLNTLVMAVSDLYIIDGHTMPRRLKELKEGISGSLELTPVPEPVNVQ